MVRRRAAHRPRTSSTRSTARARRTGSTTARPSRTSPPRRSTRSPSSSSRRCRTRSFPSMDVYIVPKHIYEKYDKKALQEVRRRGRRRLGPVHPVGVQEGPVRALRGEPELLARQAAARRRRDPQLQQRRRDGRGAAQRRDRRGAATSPAPRSTGSRATEGIETVEGNQGAFRELAINGGDGLKKGHPALSDPLVRQAIAHSIDKQTIVDRVENGHGTAADTISPSANPAWMPELARRREVRVRPREGEVAARRGRLRGHRRRRHARDARRRPAAAVPLRRALGEPAVAAARRLHDRLAEGHRHRARRRRSTTTAS